jgi:hypothetical protein
MSTFRRDDVPRRRLVSAEAERDRMMQRQVAAGGQSLPPLFKDARQDEAPPRVSAEAARDAMIRRALR